MTAKTTEKKTDALLENLRAKAKTISCNTTRYAVLAVADAYETALNTYVTVLNPPEKDEEKDKNKDE